MNGCYALLQTPVLFNRNNVKGKLFAVGNTRNNLIQFQVIFSRKTEIVPLLISITDSKGKVHTVFLMLKDENQLTVKSHLYEPDFLIRKGITVTDIQPLVTFSNRNGTDGN